MRKFYLNFRTLTILVLCMLCFCPMSFAEDASDALPRLNQSNTYSRVYNFVSGENAELSKNMGITSIGVFTINGYSNDAPNTIDFNSNSGFIVSRTRTTTLNINNVILTGATSTVGSVISNTASDATININNSTISDNYISSTSSALGGAIYSRGKLTLTNTSFTGNYAVSSSTSAKGGAIYSTNSVQMIADNSTVTISGNYTQTSTSGKTNNAIYMDSNSSSLILTTRNNGIFQIDDNIDGLYGYNITMNGDSTGQVNLYGDITNARVTISNVTVSLADGTVSTLNIPSLSVGNNVSFIIDVDMANGVADSFNVNNISGTIKISELNIISRSSDDEVKIQILKNKGSATLNIDDLSSKIDTTLKSTMYNDSILSNSITLGTTTAENDSIIISGLKDVLLELVSNNSPTNMNKNFIFRTESEYSLTSDLPSFEQGTSLSITNTSNLEYGVLNANNHSLFKLDNPITSVTLKDILIKNAYTTSSGSVAYLDSNTANFKAENSSFEHNSSLNDGGAFYAENGTLSLKNSTVSGNSSTANGGALYVTGNSNVEIVNTDFTSNKASGDGGAIYTDTNLTITADKGSSTFENNTSKGSSNAIYVASQDATLTLDAKNKGVINMNDGIDGNKDGYNIDITGDSTGVVNLSEKVSNANVTLDNSTLNLSKDNLLSGDNFNASGGTLNLANGSVGNTDFNTLTVSGKTNISVDADLANVKMDRLTATNYINSNGTINVSKIQLLSDSKENTTRILFADDPIKSAITNSVKTVTYSKIYKYTVSYNSEDGYFTFNRGGSSSGGNGGGGNSGGGGSPSLSDYNPVVTTSGVSQHVIAMNQVQNYQTAMYHSDSYMMLPRRTRLAMEKANQVAIRDYTSSFIEQALPIQEEQNAIWVRPYASYETVSLKHSPKINAINYGTVVGGESKMKTLRHGFKSVFGGFIGYNGNNIHYRSIDTNQQGAVIGLTSYLYKGNFFNTLVADIGFMISENSSNYGSDSMSSITGGFVDKFGYNIESRTGKYILQPSILLGYTCVGSSDYTTSNDVRIKTDALNVFHFAPAVKFITNLESGWQPYATISVVCNFSDSSNITANNVSLPSVSIDPYVEYGLGIQRRWNDKFSGFGQVTARSGGRRGIGILFGFRCMIGKIISRENFVFHSDPTRKVAKFRPKKEVEIEIGELPIADGDGGKIVQEPKTKHKKHKKSNVEKTKVATKLDTIKKKIFFRTDVSAKVLNDKYSDGVIIVSVKGSDAPKPDINMKEIKKLEKSLSVKKDTKEFKKNMSNINVQSGIEPSKEELLEKEQKAEFMKNIQTISAKSGLTPEEEMNTQNTKFVSLPTRDFEISPVNKNPKRINKTYLNPNSIKSDIQVQSFDDFEIEMIEN